jgi:hypothetical protein
MGFATVFCVGERSSEGKEVEEECDLIFRLIAV